MKNVVLLLALCAGCTAQAEDSAQKEPIRLYHEGRAECRVEQSTGFFEDPENQWQITEFKPSSDVLVVETIPATDSSRSRQWDVSQLGVSFFDGKLGGGNCSVHPSGNLRCFSTLMVFLFNFETLRFEWHWLGQVVEKRTAGSPPRHQPSVALGQCKAVTPFKHFETAQ